MQLTATAFGQFQETPQHFRQAEPYLIEAFKDEGLSYIDIRGMLKEIEGVNSK